MRPPTVIFAIALIGCGAAAPTSSTTPRPTDHQGIFVTTEQTCPPQASGCDILDVIDVHTAETAEDKGFDELGRRAKALGGNAVIGAEFEHGDNGGPSHLSGMIVRYSEGIPPHVVLGEIDIPSDEQSQDKGLTELSTRAQAMGGDRVINVTFEHGDNGEQGHLKGQAIRYTHD
jgi:uncharacterized protein YbjQ (UPF0145 family)